MSSHSTDSPRIDALFDRLKADKQKAFVAFVTAGDPDLDISAQILAGLPQAGADIIELGMPFTDPMADGPSIQAASQRALAAGQTLMGTLDMVRDFRVTNDTTPIVLMGYYNPIYIYGVDKFVADAKTAGVDGLIIVDLPPEEDDELCLPAMAAGVNFIRLATPTTDDKRLPEVLTIHRALFITSPLPALPVLLRRSSKRWPIILRALKTTQNYRFALALAFAHPPKQRPWPPLPMALWSARHWLM